MNLAYSLSPWLTDVSDTLWIVKKVLCVCWVSYYVGVDGPQAVAVRHTMGRATATQRVRAQRGGARPDEGSGHGKCRPGGQRPYLTGWRERGDWARAGDGSPDWTRKCWGSRGGRAGFEWLDWRFPVHSTCKETEERWGHWFTVTLNFFSSLILSLHASHCEALLSAFHTVAGWLWRWSVALKLPLQHTLAQGPSLYMLLMAAAYVVETRS